ncbi:MAG: putative prolyl oligopeptidase family protein [Clostridiales bacterium]|jgi:dipeptidyl aminopeptidase/acylaminoacyl peptidase|nr:putative prolyl oligopeptidase family protein [Clostridiales bacterium]
MEKIRYTTIDEVVEIPGFQSISIGKAGRYAAYVKRAPDWTENAYRNHVWIYDVEGKKHYPITKGKNESTSPLWAPNCSYLAYMAEVGEKDKSKNQIFLKTFDEFNGVQITNSKEGVISYKWAPDGSGIYYTAAEPESEEIKKRKEEYGDFEHIDKEYKNSYLCYIELNKAIEMALKANPKNTSEKEETKDIAVQLTNPKDFSIRGFDISSDGGKAALVCTPTSDIRDEDTSLYIFDIEAKKVNKLDMDGILSSDVVFSPEGSKIAFSITPRNSEFYKWNVIDDLILETYDLEKDKEIIKFSKLDRSITPISWTSKGILGIWQDRTSCKIGLFSDNGEILYIYNDDMSYIDSAAITEDGENIAYIKFEENRAEEVYLNNIQITNESKIYENKLLSTKEIINWNTKDGLEIEGVLSKPQDFDPNRKYPLLVVIHGGPTWASFPFLNMNKLYPIEQFVENGFIVLEPNYRGSSGYGNKFLTANFRMLGVGDYEDVISGVDMLIEKGIAASEKVGVMGWSQGGYISAFCATHSNRFKAISVGAGISNWITYYVNTDITTFTRSYLGATPWEDPEIYAKTSPMTYIKTACTPTLIQHGDRDNRVPVPNAFELYRALQDLKVESNLVIFKDMAHSPQKPGLHKAIMEQNLRWFMEHVK